MESHEWVLWVAVAGASLHVLEEYTLDWLDWARSTFGFTALTWPVFYLTNAAMMVAAISAAMIGWNSPELALSIPALFVINALFFHLLPTIVRRQFSPGLITAMLVYLPIATWAYLAAGSDGVLSTSVVVISALLGAVLMAFPIALLQLRARIVAK